MRTLALTILTMGIVLAAGNARAQHTSRLFLFACTSCPREEVLRVTFNHGVEAPKSLRAHQKTQKINSLQCVRNACPINAAQRPTRQALIRSFEGNLRQHRPGFQPLVFAKTGGPLPYTPKDHSEAHTNSTPDGFTDGAGKRGSWT